MVEECRLGFIVDFLSHATIVGFMGGAATVVCLQQLKSILGLEHFTHEADIVSVMRSVFSQTHQVTANSTLSLQLSYFFSIFLSHTVHDNTLFTPKQALSSTTPSIHLHNYLFSHTMLPFLHFSII